MGVRVIGEVGRWVLGSKTISGSNERALIKDSSAFSGIEKARSGAEIRHFECCKNGRFQPKFLITFLKNHSKHNNSEAKGPF